MRAMAQLGADAHMASDVAEILGKTSGAGRTPAGTADQQRAALHPAAWLREVHGSAVRPLLAPLHGPRCAAADLNDANGLAPRGRLNTQRWLEDLGRDHMAGAGRAPLFIAGAVGLALVVVVKLASGGGGDPAAALRNRSPEATARSCT